MVCFDEDDTMENVKEGNNEGSVEFSWGRKVDQRPVNNFQLYESFHYDGVEYIRKDCVYLWGEDKVEPYIGKILKIWETPQHKKKVKIVWFFRPVEIHHWLGDSKPLKNELFLASGKGDSVFNINPLEAIAGKCKVICTSKDTRNIPASVEGLKEHNFFFCRTFDVDTYKISDKFPDIIAGHDVKCFFNQKKEVELRGRPATQGFTVEDGNSSTSTKPLEKQVSKSKFVAVGCGKHLRSSDEETTLKQKIMVAKEVTGIGKSSSQFGRNKFNCPTVYSQIVKKRRLESTSVPNTDDLTRRPEHGGRLLEPKASISAEPSKLNFIRKTSGVSDKEVVSFDKRDKADSQILEVTGRPDMDKRNWFNQQGWDDRMRTAEKNGSLVLLLNLDPSYTSSEVEDIIWHVFGRNVSAKMVQRTSICSQHFGEAYVIFNTKDAAESAMYELYKKCLVLSGGRPVVACRRPIQGESSSTPSKFPGHIVIQNLKYKMQRQETRDAVSTSHCSQPNTVEYELAMEWRTLQEKSRLWWDALHKNQAAEVEKYRALFKTDFNLPTETKPTL